MLHVDSWARARETTEMKIEAYANSRVLYELNLRLALG